MKQLDDAAMEFARTHKGAAAEHSTPQPGNFFYLFKRLTLVGYYTSEIGFKQELRKTIIPPGHQSCAPLPEVRS
jgi:Gluconate 2-dehydrogenase subunit 3